MNLRLTIIALGLPLSFGFVGADAQADADPTVATEQRPETGSSIAWGHAETIVDAPISEVLPSVVEYADYVEFMPNFARSKVLAQRGSRARVYVEVKVAKGVITLWGQLDMVEREDVDGARIIKATLVQGNVNAFSAEWKVTPVDGDTRTHVEFNLYVDPDIALPAAVFSRENERAAGRALRALQERVGGPSPDPTEA
ncbi:MAG: SRPBCC family protein [Myxococcota bacterium]